MSLDPTTSMPRRQEGRTSRAKKKDFVIRETPAWLLTHQDWISDGARKLLNAERALMDQKTGRLFIPGRGWIKLRTIERHAQMCKATRLKYTRELERLGFIRCERPSVTRMIGGRWRTVKGEVQITVLPLPRQNPHKQGRYASSTDQSHASNPHKQRDSGISSNHGKTAQNSLLRTSSSTVEELVRQDLSNSNIKAPLPSPAPLPLEQAPGGGSSSSRHHQGLRAETRRERDDCRPEGDLELVRIHNLKTTALAKFSARHSEIDPSLAKLWVDLIEERAKRTIVSAEYFVTALENELRDHEELGETESATTNAGVSKPSGSQSHVQDSAKRNSDRRNAALLFWEHKLTKSGTVPVVEEARHKILEAIDEKGLFKSWEKCRDFFALIRTDVFPKTPEPREGDERSYFPETVLELLDLVSYSRDLPELYGFGVGYNKVLRYLLCASKFNTSEERRKFEDDIARRQEQKKSDEERMRVKKRNRERRVERKARSAMDSNDAIAKSQ